MINKQFGLLGVFLYLAFPYAYAEVIGQQQLDPRQRELLNAVAVSDGGCPASETATTSAQLFRWVAAAPNPDAIEASIIVAADLFPLAVCIEAWRDGEVSRSREHVERKSALRFDVSSADFVVITVQGLTFSIFQDAGVEPVYLSDGLVFPMRRAFIEMQPWVR